MVVRAFYLRSQEGPIKQGPSQDERGGGGGFALTSFGQILFSLPNFAPTSPFPFSLEKRSESKTPIKVRRVEGEGGAERSKKHLPLFPPRPPRFLLLSFDPPLSLSLLWPGNCFRHQNFSAKKSTGDLLLSGANVLFGQRA